MQKCNKCGADIRYIAIGSEKCIVCDAQELQFVTENGRQTKGYLIHTCKKMEGENERSESSNKSGN